MDEQSELDGICKRSQEILNDYSDWELSDKGSRPFKVHATGSPCFSSPPLQSPRIYWAPHKWTLDKFIVQTRSRNGF